MIKTVLIFCLCAAVYSGTFVGASYAKSVKEGEGRAVALWGEIHRSRIGYYLERLNELTSLNPDQNTRVRNLLEQEADKFTDAQMAHMDDLLEMLHEVVEIANKTHLKLAKILNEDQQHIMPTVVESRKARLKDSMGELLDTIWDEEEGKDS